MISDGRSGIGAAARCAAAILVGALMMPVAASASAAATGEGAPSADEVRGRVETAIAWLNRSWDGAARVRLGGAPRVVAGGDRFWIELPEVTGVGSGESGAEAGIRLGTVVVGLEVLEGGRWRVSGALPVRGDLFVGGAATGRVTATAANLSWDFDPADGFSYRLDLTGDGVRVEDLHMDEQVVGIGLGQVSLRSELEASGDGRWLERGGLELRNLSATISRPAGATGAAGAAGATDAVEVVRIDRLAFTGRGDGNGGSGLERLHRLHGLGLRLEAGTPAVADWLEWLALLAEPSDLFGGLAGEMVAEGVAIRDGDSGAPLGGAARLRLWGSLDSLSSNAVAVELGYRQAGLVVSASTAAPNEPAAGAGGQLEQMAGAGGQLEQMVPPDGEIVLAASRLPVREALTMVGQMLRGGSAAAELTAKPLETVALELLARAGAAFEIKALRLEGPSGGVSAGGRVVAHAGSPYGAVGEATITVRGLESVAQVVGTLAERPLEPAEVALTAALGIRETLPDGRLVRHYRFGLRDDGTVLFNDNDVTPLLREVMGQRGEKEEVSAGAPPAGPSAAAGPGEPPRTEPPPVSVANAPAAPVTAGMVPLTPELAVALLKEHGLVAQIKRSEDDGLPTVVAPGDRLLPVDEVVIDFFDCTDQEGRSCESVMLWSWFSPPRAVRLEALNDWNQDHRWVRAYRDEEEDVRLEMDLGADGGIDRRILAGRVDTYLKMVPDFVATVGRGRAPTR